MKLVNIFEDVYLLNENQLDFIKLKKPKLISWLYFIMDGKNYDFQHNLENLNDCSICQEKINSTKISNSRKIYVCIGRDQYLRNDYIFPLSVKTKTFMLKDFLKQVTELWEKIYKEEGESRPHPQLQYNRDITDGKYGIGYHYLSDLSISDISTIGYVKKDSTKIPVISFYTDS